MVRAFRERVRNGRNSLALKEELPGENQWAEPISSHISSLQILGTSVLEAEQVRKKQTGIFSRTASTAALAHSDGDSSYFTMEAPHPYILRAAQFCKLLG